MVRVFNMGKKKQPRGSAPGGSKRPSSYRPDPTKKKDKETGIQKRDEEHILQDDRFSRITTDPRFRGIPNAEKKLKIDARFKSMFSDKRFDHKHTVDKRGRPVNFSSSDNLKKFYQLDGSKEKNGKTSSEKGKGTDERFKVKSEGTSDEDESESKEDDDDDPSHDLARGKGNMESSSDDSDSDEDEDTAADEEIEHPWAEFATDAPQTEEVTHRLALVNMDWDGIKADDIFSLLNSFKPASGVIKSVTIYPSEYGVKQLEEEKQKGPLSLKEEAKADTDEEEEDIEESDEAARAKGNEQLREYQLNRMKYYYAVVECDSPETANKIYEECDGLEYENSSTAIDLRYIPDGMTFDQEARSVATSLPANYVASEFVNSALQQSTVKCSWDETPRDRKGLPAVTDWEKQDDLQAYLASSSSEEEEVEEPFVDGPNADNRSVRSTCSMKDPEAIERYRALILGLDNDEKPNKSGEEDSDGDVDLEVDWEPGLKTSATTAVEKKLEAAKLEKLTPFEKVLEKQAAKRQAKKQAKQRDTTPDLSSALADEGDDDLVGSDEEAAEKAESDQDAEEEEDKDATAQLELLVGDIGGKRHFSLTNLMSDAKESKTKRKKKRKLAAAAAAKAPAEQPDDFTMDLADPRFSALYTSSQYNVDMSDPSFKKTKAMDAVVSEKLKRRGAGVSVDLSASASDPSLKSLSLKIRPEISSLAKSVKAKVASAAQKKLKK